jgi:hypothetical protein
MAELVYLLLQVRFGAWKVDQSGSGGLNTGTVGALMEDTQEVYDLVVGLLGDKKAPENYTSKDAAFTKFYSAAKTLSETSLEQLKKEGVKTSLSDGNVGGFLP